MKKSPIIMVFIALGILACATRTIQSVTIFVIQGRVLDRQSNFPLEGVDVYFIDTGYNGTLSAPMPPIKVARSDARGKIEVRLNYPWRQKRTVLDNPIIATFDIVLSRDSYQSQRFHFKESELQTDSVSHLVDLKDVYMIRQPESAPDSGHSRSASAIWAELLQKTPFPHMAPLPAPVRTALDGTYAKFDPRKTPPVPCRRCPEYVPQGGIWKLNFNSGIFRIFHELSGWRSLGSFVVEGNHVRLFNDPCCIDVQGVYQWNSAEGRITLEVVEDPCAIGLRAQNLTQLPWLSCDIVSGDASGGNQRIKPPECQ